MNRKVHVPAILEAINANVNQVKIKIANAHLKKYLVFATLIALLVNALLKINVNVTQKNKVAMNLKVRVPATLEAISANAHQVKIRTANALLK